MIRRSVLLAAAAGFLLANSPDAAVPESAPADDTPPSTGTEAPASVDAVPEQAGTTAKAAIECMHANSPDTTSQMFIEFTSVDAVGSKQVKRAQLKHKKFENGLRRMKLRFTRPNDLRGSAFLVMENETRASEMFIYSPELRKAKRVSSNSAGGSIGNTDFTADDFSRWQNMARVEPSKLLPNTMVDERPTWVVESRPADDQSSYVRVVTYIDQETCVALKIESFETEKRLRKVLTATTDEIVESNGKHVATELLMEDVLDETRTEVLIEDVAFDVPIKDREFLISRLSRD